MKFRNLSLALLMLSASLEASAQLKPLQDNSQSPHDKIRTIGMVDCRWSDGFWAERYDLCQDVIIPNIWSLVNDVELSHIYENFLIAAGEREGEFAGFLFSDADFFKLVEAMSCSYAGSGDEKLDKLMDEIIAVIAKAQREDGYITTGKTIGHGTQMNFDHTFTGDYQDNEIFSKDKDHELYNFGHLFTAACVHYRATGKRNFLDIAIKAADFLYGIFLTPTPELAAVHWNPPHFMGLVELYRTTGDSRYLELTASFIDMAGMATTSASGRGLDHSQKRIPFREERKAVGHAVHGNYFYSGVADYCAESGDEELLTSLNAVWEDAMSSKIYVTGACGSYLRKVEHEGVVGECYGDEYDLPHSRGYAETCANISVAMWNWRMFLASGEAKYMDIAELSLYNSLLSGVSLDGMSYFYKNPIRFMSKFLTNHFEGQCERSPYLNCFCCPPNLARTIIELNSYAYATSERGLYVNIYGSSKLATTLADGSPIELTQSTDYPWDGKIAITIDKIATKEPLSLMLRIPGWAPSAEIKLNGKRLEGNIACGEYFESRRSWSEGDVIEIDLPMEPTLIQGHAYMEDAMGQVAIKRGPIVYCLESIDLPDGVGIEDVMISRSSKIKATYEPDLLSGVVLLKGDLYVDINPRRDSELYSPISTSKPKRISAQFIPYYSWCNRGVTDMSVWLPYSR